MQFGADHIHRPRAAVTPVAQRAPRSHACIEDRLGNGLALEKHAVGFKRQPDNSHKHHAEAAQDGRLTVGKQILSVGIQFAGESVPAFFEPGFKVAAHQPQPVAVGQNFVMGVHGGDGILQVHDGGECAFDADVAHPRQVGASDR